MKVAVWQVAFFTIFVLALPTYFPDLSWQAYAILYAVLVGLWAVAIWDLRRWWRDFSQRHFPGSGTS